MPNDDFIWFVVRKREVESDWYDLWSRLTEMILTDSVRRMGENVRKANTGIHVYGTRVIVFDRNSFR